MLTFTGLLLKISNICADCNTSEITIFVLDATQYVKRLKTFIAANCADMAGICYEHGSELLNEKILSVYEVFQRTFNEYNLTDVFLSFNGGKDCTVLLHLLHNFMQNSGIGKTINVLYIQPENSFDEVESFVAFCEQIYGLHIEKIKGKLRNVLEQVCSHNKNFKVVIMGCRRTDPFCENLSTYQFTDPGWPPLLRVNPLLNWTCKNIWDYIRQTGVPYCPLYDDGYTSLGDKENTTKNPYLELVDPMTGVVSYKPAYELTDDKLERAGRYNAL